MAKQQTADDRKRAIMRAATTKATKKYGQGGRLKHKNKPKPITLPTFKFETDK